ncbi:MAG: hypothetical protein HYR56_28315 [Acidobacteria bacterium]|nr:hypothetical protein [Acidobacteriota bacterium]MBI3497356.1 hypothetical protein [Pseudomonadota bacterium]
MRNSLDRLVAVASACVLLGVSSCASIDGISGSAAMRVEVEVYKGPLSKDPEVQWGELVGTLNEANSSIETLRKYLSLSLGKGRRYDASYAFHLQEIIKDLTAVEDLLDGVRIAANAWHLRYYGTTPGSFGLSKDFVKEITTSGESQLRDKISNKIHGLLEYVDGYGLCSARPQDPVNSSDLVGWLRMRYALDRCVEDELLQLAAAKRENSPQSTAAQQGTPVLSPENKLALLYQLRDEYVSLVEKLRYLESYSNLPAVEPRDTANLPKIQTALTAILAEAATAAQQFRNKALVWAQSHVPFPLDTQEGRSVPITASTMLSTYADKIGPRADTLLRQVKGVDRRELPLTVALRETTPPAFLKQYIWNDAAPDIRQYFGSSGGDGIGSVRDRVRVIEKLFTDENWNNINTVHASGQGTVRMALIKDDIGNWNLKSFDQDPSDLLDAYKNVGLAALKAAADVAKNIASSGGAGALQSAAGLANQLTFGSAQVTSPTLGSRNIDQLHADTAARLTQLKDQTATKVDDLNKKIADLEPKVRDAKAATDAAKTDLDTAQKAQDDADTLSTQAQDKTRAHDALEAKTTPPAGQTRSDDVQKTWIR